MKRIVNYKGLVRSFCSTARNLINKDNLEDYMELQSLNMSTCVIWGDEDRIVDYEYIDVLKGVLPSAEYHTMHKSGHAFVATRAKETSEIISNFINK